MTHARDRRRGRLIASLAALCALSLPAAAVVAADRPPHEATAGQAGSAHPFERAPKRKRAIVWAVGDGADGRRPAKRLARRIEKSKLDRFLYLGDVYEHGSYSDFREDYHSVYGRLARKTAPTPGNHDWARHASGYDRYWKRITGRRPPHYYAFTLAGWRILSLNSEDSVEPDSAQLRWLEGELREPGNCRLAFWHSPRYSAGTVHRDRPDLAPLWDALKGHATLVVNGHDHNMQRLEPLDGITGLIAGTGGHGHYAVDRDDKRLVFADTRRDGALRLVLRPGRAGFAFVSAGGHKLHSGRVSCQSA